MNVLVTGGAGYVGSVTAEELLKSGHHVLVLDNLQQGHRSAVLPECEFIFVDIKDTQLLDETFARNKIDAVIHMAAETVIEYSMTDPKRYFLNNVAGGLNLLDVMVKHGVLKLIFSSSAAVYGEPEKTPIDENHHKNPVNSYGESKLMFENILKWYGTAYGMKYVAFRYFNAAGASDCLGEDHRPETHLIPNIIKAALNGSPVSVFGNDYPTKDGTCVRDYVHVRDIAQAHIMALNNINAVSGQSYNLGNSEGYSVLDVINITGRITGRAVKIEYRPKRAGDPAILVASSEKVRSEISWKPKFPLLDDIIASAWQWMKKHPHGYE